MSEVETVITFAVGLVSGVLVAVGSTVITDRIAQGRAKETARTDLLLELNQNIRHQQVSFMIPLEDDAYQRFRSLGYMASLNTDIQDFLREVYSRIRNKNGLVEVHLAKGDGVGIRGADGVTVGVMDVINRLTTEINNLLGDLATLFEDERYVE